MQGWAELATSWVSVRCEHEKKQTSSGERCLDVIYLTFNVYYFPAFPALDNNRALDDRTWLCEGTAQLFHVNQRLKRYLSWQ